MAIPSKGKRCLVLAMDKTYLLKGVDVVKLRRGKGYIGTAFGLTSLHRRHGENPIADIEDIGVLPLCSVQEAEEARAAQEEGKSTSHSAWDASTLNYANEMCEFLMWHPGMESLPRLPVCTVPMSTKCTGRQMLELVGHILEAVGPIVQSITFDNATNHNEMKSFLLGLQHHLTEEEVASLPFWKDVNFEPLPSCCLPKFPFRRPVFANGEVLLLGSMMYISILSFF